jgi:hypothetical protein
MWADSAPGRELRRKISAGTVTTAATAGVNKAFDPLFRYLKRKQLASGHIMSEEDWEELFEEVDADVWWDRLNCKSSNTAGGASTTTVDMVRCPPEQIGERIRQLCQLMITTGHVFTLYGSMLLCPIAKIPGNTAAANARPLMLEEVLLKHTMGAQTDIIRKKLEELGALEENAFGFRKGRGVPQAATTMTQVIEDCNANFRECHIVALDIKRAYDSGERTTVRELALRRMGVPEAFITTMARLDACSSVQVVTGYGLSGEIGAEGCFKPETGLAQGAEESPILFVIAMDLPLTMANGEDIRERAYHLASKDGIDVAVNSMVYADDVQAVTTSVEGAEKTIECFSLACRLYGFGWAAHKCIYTALLPRLKAGGKGVMEFVEVEDVVPALPTPNIVDPLGIDPPKKIPVLRSDEAFRNLGIMHDARGQWADQRRVTSEKIKKGAAAASSHALSSDGAAMIVTKVLLPQALFPLQCAALNEDSTKSIEAPARRLWLHSQGAASTMPRRLVEMSIEQGGLGWRSWWNEVNREKLIYALTTLQLQTLPGRVMRAALWRLSRNVGHLHPLRFPPAGQPPRDIDTDWLGRLGQWCHEIGIEVRDHEVHASPTHRMLGNGPPRDNHGAVDRGNDAYHAAMLELVDGYDWVRPAGPKVMALRPEIVQVATTTRGLLDTLPHAATWLDRALALARNWVKEVNRVAQTDPQFHVRQLPIRRGELIGWEEKEASPQGTNAGRALGLVVICCEREVAVHRLVEEPRTRPSGTGTRVATCRFRTAAPPRQEWVARPLIYRVDAFHEDRWENSHVGSACAQMTPEWTPEIWHHPDPPAPEPTSLSPKMPPLAAIGPAPKHLAPPPRVELEEASADVQRAKASGAGVRAIRDAITARERARGENEAAGTRAAATRCADGSDADPPPWQEPEEKTPEEQTPEEHHAYSDGSFKHLSTTPVAAWGVVRADIEKDPVPREDQKWGGRLTGPLNIIGVDRAELMGLNVLLSEGTVALGGVGMDVGHVDRKSTLDIAARLGSISRRDFLQLDHGDLWDSVQCWTTHLHGRYRLEKVTAHVDKIRPRRERTAHEWGNEAADREADRRMRAPLPDSATALRLPALTTRASRWRLHGADGGELTNGLNKVVRGLCADRAQRLYAADRLEGGRQPILSIDPRLQVHATNAERRAILGPCVEMVGEGVAGEYTPEAWLNLSAGRGGGGNHARQAQLCKFLSRRLPTQHIKERYAAGADKAGHLPCNLCRAPPRADNDHLLFVCTHPEIVAARRHWVERVRAQCEDEEKTLPRAFRIAVMSFWTTNNEGQLASSMPPVAAPVAPPPEQIVPPARVALRTLLPYMGVRWEAVQDGNHWNWVCEGCDQKHGTSGLRCAWCNLTCHRKCNVEPKEHGQVDWACAGCRSDGLAALNKAKERGAYGVAGADGPDNRDAGDEEESDPLSEGGGGASAHPPARRTPPPFTSARRRRLTPGQRRTTRTWRRARGQGG